jgi:hypothetical protein
LMIVSDDPDELINGLEKFNLPDGLERWVHRRE